MTPTPTLGERPPEGPSAGSVRWIVAILPLLLFAGAATLVTSCRHHGHPRHDPEAMLDHARFAADRILDRIDATEEQRSEVLEIIDAAAFDLVALAPDRRALHEHVVREFTAETVDRAALEQLRADHVARMEAVSRRLVEAAADVADVLSQEQRQEVATLAERFHGRRSRVFRWHR